MALTINLYYQINVSCNALCNGYLSVMVTGGTAPYTYSWSNGETTSAISNLCAGSYTLTVTDSVGATASNTYTITQPTVLSVAISTTDFCLQRTGTLTATPSGGSSPYIYLWNTGETTQAITASEGIWSVVVTDNNGCTANGSITLSSTPVYATVTGYADGHAIVHPSGGTPPYTFLWYTIPNQTGQTAYNLAAGTYYVLVTDSVGCTFLADVTIVDCDTLFLINANCCLAELGECWKIERSYGNDTEDLQDRFDNLKAWIDILRCYIPVGTLISQAEINACGITDTVQNFSPIDRNLPIFFQVSDLELDGSPLTVTGVFTSVLALMDAVMVALSTASGQTWTYIQVSTYVFQLCSNYTLNGTSVILEFTVTQEFQLGNIRMTVTIGGGVAPEPPVYQTEEMNCITTDQMCTVKNKIMGECKNC